MADAWELRTSYRGRGAPCFTGPEEILPMSHAVPLLSMRRREIAILLTEGRTLDEIARMLTITPAAVADDVQFILQRLDPASRAEVMSWASERAAATGAARLGLWVVKPASRAA